ncbi:hypothetical protein E1285_44815 [Actinomadura sp. 7K507]|nr:hypothetical protein E1285_44815 [Actinomadura sp. 7K507]
MPEPAYVPPVRSRPVHSRDDANEAFRAAAQPAANDFPGGEPPKLVFRTPPSSEAPPAQAPESGAYNRPPRDPWNPWADGPPEPGPPPPRRTKRGIVPNPDGTGWHWGEVEDDGTP